MARRFKATAPIKMAFWKPNGKLWYAVVADLENAIRISGHSDAILRNRLGAGYHYTQDILDGKRIDGWAVSHIEWGLPPQHDPLANK
jgi:hypothetical protein